MSDPCSRRACSSAKRGETTNVRECAIRALFPGFSNLAWPSCPILMVTMRLSIATAVCGCGVLLGGALLINGCAGDKNGSANAPGGKDLQEINAKRSDFESANDPPLTAETHFAAGQLNETQGNAALAIEQYEAALKLNPKYIPALYRMAFVYSQSRDFPKAIETWTRYIDVTNHSAIGYSNLGYCQELSGDADTAELSYQAGIEHDASSQACRVNYGLMLTRQGRIEEAKAQFGAVLSPAEAHYNIASVLQQQGKKDAARAEFIEALKTDPKLADAQTRLAELEKN
jgi:tetratricopeptide (TPR) repeat protein